MVDLLTVLIIGVIVWDWYACRRDERDWDDEIEKEQFGTGIATKTYGK